MCDGRLGLRLLRRYLTYANVLSTLALFLALGGSAVAAQRYLVTSTTQLSPAVVSSLHGAIGARGLRGYLGERGPKGDVGAVGDRGAEGPQGAKGDAGPIGAAGIKGDTGAIGATGIQGAKGDTGPTGVTGAVGPQGNPGSQGPAGPTGGIGSVGPQGPKGLTGAQGVKGDAGATGAAGPTGPPGLPGALAGSVPSGVTIKGVYGFETDVPPSTDPEYVAAYISYPVPLPQSPIDAIFSADGNSRTHCPGTSRAPAADPGYVCIYRGYSVNVGTTPYFGDPQIPSRSTTSLLGIAVEDTVTATTASSTITLDQGSWAYTAP
jgi:hypothetical protein